MFKLINSSFSHLHTDCESDDDCPDGWECEDGWCTTDSVPPEIGAAMKKGRKILR